jgi:hypothetical protein
MALLAISTKSETHSVLEFWQDSSLELNLLMQHHICHNTCQFQTQLCLKYKNQTNKYKNQPNRIEGVGPERFRATGAVSARKEIRWVAD